MSRNVELVNGCIYHVFNRGVDKRDIFLDKNDYFRFLVYLMQFNSAEHVPNIRYMVNEIVQGQTSNIIEKFKQLVEIICFCLMPNHFHFILRQLVDNGISKFMQKIGTGYTMYFNEKNKRTGRLFESKYKLKLIETDEYLMYLSKYIHLNCLDLIVFNWKEEGIKDWDRVNKFLGNYKWSSYLDYIGKNNFPYIINKEAIMQYFKTPEDYMKYVQGWEPGDMNMLEAGDLLIE